VVVQQLKQLQVLLVMLFVVSLRRSEAGALLKQKGLQLFEVLVVSLGLALKHSEFLLKLLQHGQRQPLKVSQLRLSLMKGRACDECKFQVLCMSLALKHVSDSKPAATSRMLHLRLQLEEVLSMTLLILVSVCGLQLSLGL
jgi:hypothetical protein